jgi:hypothetical protein
MPNRIVLIVLFTQCFGHLCFSQTTQLALSMTVSPKGDLALQLGSQKVADGRWRLAYDAGQFFGTDEARLGDIASTTTVVESPVHAVVTDLYPASKATYDLTLDGEDLRINLHLENLDKIKILRKICLVGLTFHFDHPANGTLSSNHWTYLAAKGLSIFHPSLAQPTGGVYARDDRFGLGVFSNSEFDRQDLFNADFEKDGIIPAECRLQFMNTREVPPGQAIDLDVNFRISGDTSGTHLLGGYKKVYTEHFPKLLYDPDNRPVAAFNGTDKSFVTAGNPLGFGGAIRRLDSTAGYRAYVRLVAPVLQQANALGVIFWSPGGYREPMYPPDFDDFPQAVRRNIPGLVDGFTQRGLHVGLCARCGAGVIREEGKAPVLYRLSASNPTDMKTMLDRFGHAMDMGFDLFYLDDFGADGLNDLEILKKVRAVVGPKVQLYTEFCTDMSLPYAGRYCEWQDNAVLWTRPPVYEALRFLCPDSIWLCISKTGRPIPPEFAKLGLTPLVEDMLSNRLPVSPRGKQN